MEELGSYSDLNAHKKPYRAGCRIQLLWSGQEVSGGGSNAEQAAAQAEGQELSQTEAWGDPERRKRHLYRSVPLTAVSRLLSVSLSAAS